MSERPLRALRRPGEHVRTRVSHGGGAGPLVARAAATAAAAAVGACRDRRHHHLHLQPGRSASRAATAAAARRVRLVEQLGVLEAGSGARRSPRTRDRDTRSEIEKPHSACRASPPRPSGRFSAVSRCTAATTPSPPRSPAAPTPADAAIRRVVRRTTTFGRTRDVNGLEREVERHVPKSSQLDRERAPLHVLAEELDRLAYDLRRRRRPARAMELRVLGDAELERQ